MDGDRVLGLQGKVFHSRVVKTIEMSGVPEDPQTGGYERRLNLIRWYLLDFLLSVLFQTAKISR